MVGAAAAWHINSVVFVNTTFMFHASRKGMMLKLRWKHTNHQPVNACDMQHTTTIACHCTFYRGELEASRNGHGKGSISHWRAVLAYSDANMGFLEAAGSPAMKPPMPSGWPDRRSIVPGAAPESPANVGGASGTGAKFSPPITSIGFPSPSWALGHSPSMMALPPGMGPSHCWTTNSWRRNAKERNPSQKKEQVPRVRRTWSKNWSQRLHWNDIFSCGAAVFSSSRDELMCVITVVVVGCCL